MGAMASQITSLNRLFKENMKAPHHWPFAGNSPMTDDFPAQMASNAENVSIRWRHHGKLREIFWKGATCDSMVLTIIMRNLIMRN